MIVLLLIVLVCRDDDGGWSPEDAYRFRVILNQYPEAMRGYTQRDLYLDRLAREFPQHRRQHLVRGQCSMWWVAIACGMCKLKFGSSKVTRENLNYLFWDSSISMYTASIYIP